MRAAYWARSQPIKSRNGITWLNDTPQKPALYQRLTPWTALNLSSVSTTSSPDSIG